MTTIIGPHETYSLVSPQTFSNRMDKHWTDTLGLVSSTALRRLWEIMASTFVKSIKNATNDDGGAPWLILQPPTGSGKTQGACLFAAMQAEANAAGPLRSVGVVIVTRLISQADEIADTINKHLGRMVAVAHHSDSRASPQELLDRDILVITHQAYINAADCLNGRDAAPWLRLITWRGGRRKLTIIDEALANAVEANKVTLEDLAHTLAYVPHELKLQFPDQIDVLLSLHERLSAHADPKSRPDDRALRMLWDDTAPVEIPDMAPLRAAMKLIRYDAVVLHEENEGSRLRISRRVDETLRDAQAVLESWAFYAQSGAVHSINSASFLIPRDIPPPVVMDATANANFLWNLLGSQAQIVPTPTNARNYSTVRLHVARAAGVGKHSMIQNADTRFPRLFAALEREIGPERSVFICTHKANEHRATHWAHGHWGAIDGRNDWQECDTAVIFGLPYLDRVWSTGVFMALQGPQDHDWFESPSWGEHEDVRAVMEQRQLSASIIQSINRIRCRRVIDAQGRSLPADVYIVLPPDKTGDAILADICADMPNLRVVPWSFEMDGPKVRRVRSSSARDALVTFMANRLPGETALSKVQRELGMTPKQLKKLKEDLRNTMHATTTALAALGVAYVVRGAGRGAKTFLVKQGV